MRAGETGNSGHGDLRRCPWARLRQVEDERLYISTVPVLEAKVRRINTWQLKTDSYYRIHMMSDDLNLGSLKAPMVLESTLTQSYALRELNNTLAKCLHLKYHEQM